MTKNKPLTEGDVRSLVKCTKCDNIQGVCYKEKCPICKALLKCPICKALLHWDSEEIRVLPAKDFLSALALLKEKIANKKRQLKSINPMSNGHKDYIDGIRIGLSESIDIIDECFQLQGQAEKKQGGEDDKKIQIK